MARFFGGTVFFHRIEGVERMMGFEPTTSTLARLRSTPELHPRRVDDSYGLFVPESRGSHKSVKNRKIGVL